MRPSRLRLPLPARRTIAATLCCFAAASPHTAAAAPRAVARLQGPASAETPPPVAREFRAAWVATVGNIDWPSRPGLSTWDQQQELLAILNRATQMKLNAIVFHIQPGGDAF